MENQLLELIKTRRSCRHYKAEQVSDKELNAVLEAGEYAPTGHGLQDPIIVAVQNDDIKAQLAHLSNVQKITSAENLQSRASDEIVPFREFIIKDDTSALL